MKPVGAVGFGGSPCVQALQPLHKKNQPSRAMVARPVEIMKSIYREV
jgi:hypothetical protein